MKLLEFGEMYLKLEEKALSIMEVYNIGHHDLESISTEKLNNKMMFNINTSIYYSGCRTGYEALSFEIEEMSNDIEYFKDVYKKEQEKIESDKLLAEEKRVRDIKKKKEIKDEEDYKRLKEKFEK